MDGSLLDIGIFLLATFAGESGEEKNADVEKRPVHVPASKQSEQRLHGIAHLTGRLRRPRRDVYREPGKPNSRLLRPGELTVHLGCRRHVGGVGGFRRCETSEVVPSAVVAKKTPPPPALGGKGPPLGGGGFWAGVGPFSVFFV